MDSILREKLVAMAFELSTVGDVYRNESHRFVAAYLSWLEAASKSLSGLRAHIVMLFQAESSRLLAVADGALPDQVKDVGSIRKRQRAVAAQSLEKMSHEMHAKIEALDHQLEQHREKLCHAVAMLGAKDPGLYARLDPSESGLAALWASLARTPETLPMFNYFCAKLTATDRSCLLADVVSKIVANRLVVAP